MHRASYQTVVDQMVSVLAQNRRTRLDRHAAYVALARAIVADEAAERRDLPDIDGRKTAHAA
jgi:hypothetical protein